MHPDNLLYSPDHVWVKQEKDGSARLGMTYHYQQTLKKIVYVDLPAAGAIINRGEPFASFESSKTAADLLSPLSGTVLEANPIVADKPGTVNADPYGAGWMALVKSASPDELKDLMSSKEYIASIIK